MKKYVCMLLAACLCEKKTITVVNLQEYIRDGGLLLAPVAFGVPFGNMLLKVLLNERLPRDEQYILHEYVEQ